MFLLTIFVVAEKKQSEMRMFLLTIFVVAEKKQSGTVSNTFL